MEMDTLQEKRLSDKRNGKLFSCCQDGRWEGNAKSLREGGKEPQECASWFL